MGKTNIEWADEVWNPTTGCIKVSAGCKNCYAEMIAHRFWGARKFTDVQCHTDRLDIPLHWRKPRRVFVNSMSDLFHGDVPDEFIAKVFDVMGACEQHTFMVLTKRPNRMKYFLRSSNRPTVKSKYGGWFFGGKFPLHNVMLGVSVENQETADERTPLLLQTPAAVRFLSCEPLLEPIKVGMYLSRTNMPGLNLMPGFRDPLPGIDWIVVGGESGPKARPCDVEWIRSIVRQCKIAGVPSFVKQDYGQRPGIQGRIPDDLWTIKEFPNAVQRQSKRA